MDIVSLYRSSTVFSDVFPVMPWYLLTQFSDVDKATTPKTKAKTDILWPQAKA